jgi:hypothetical protein
MNAAPNKGRVFINYVITYLLIGFSDIPFFDYNRKARMAFLVVLGFLFFYYKRKIGKDLLVMIVIAIYLILFQSLYFGGGKLFTTVTLTSLLIVMPYFAVKIVGPMFLRYYRNIMLLMALIGLAFWVGVNASSGFHQAIHTWAVSLGSIANPELGAFNESIIIYTYEKFKVSGFIRNAGAFHEPGAYSVFLILAIISEIFMTGKLLTRANLIFFASIVTTFSTAGFLGLFVVVAFYVYTSRRMTLLTKLFISVCMIGIVVYLFMTLEFLGDKIANQMEEQTETQLNTATSGRFLGARKALIVIWRYPLFGRGFIAASKADATSEEAAGYGWITWISQIGLIFGLFYMYYLYKALRNYSVINIRSRLFALFAFGAMLAVLGGQKHTNTLVFFVLFLVPVAFPYHSYWQDYLIRKAPKIRKSKKPRRMGFNERAKLQKTGVREGFLKE